MQTMNQDANVGMQFVTQKGWRLVGVFYVRAKEHGACTSQKVLPGKCQSGLLPDADHIPPFTESVSIYPKKRKCGDGEKRSG